jgi:transposase-like protein
LRAAREDLVVRAASTQVEELLAERGIELSYETVRRRAEKFGTRYAKRLRAVRPRPSRRWHLDEMFVSIGGKTPVFVACRRKAKSSIFSGQVVCADETDLV